MECPQCHQEMKPAPKGGGLVEQAVECDAAMRRIDGRNTELWNVALAQSSLVIRLAEAIEALQARP